MEKRTKMPISERAKQFAPFASLRGYGKTIKNKQKIVMEKRELIEEEIDALNQTIVNLKKGDIITVTYYDNGGYVELQGYVSKIDLVFRNITVIKTQIRFDDISKILLEK